MIVHGLLKSFDAVLVRGVELEGEAHQRCSLLVDDDGVDLSAVADVDAGVEVADRRTGDGAAVLGLVCHLELDVLPGLLVLAVVHDVLHRFHGFGLDAFAEIVLGRDDADAECAECFAREHGVFDVAEGT
nr:hypothetical protein [Flexivirga caeni]